jgi:hypothetical protein
MQNNAAINTQNAASEHLSETLIVEKQTLIKAFLELERQEEIQTYLALAKVRQMENLLQGLKEILQGERTLCAKHKLHQLFLPHSEWISIFTDERIATWQVEAETILGTQNTDL